MWKRLIAVLILGLIGPGCQTNPATGKKQLNMLSPQREIAMGSEASPKFIKAYGGEIPSEPILAYVRGIGHRLAEVSERPELPWEFHVVDSAVINAFALPGGKVFISRGLLVKLNSEAQLAGVLGHEVGHVTAKHINDRMAQALGWGIAGAAIGAAGQTSDQTWLKGLGIGVGVGGTVYQLKFSRSQESQADELGVRYMTRLGYNPVAQIQVMKVLKKEAGSGNQPEFLSTHPYPDTRIKRLRKLIKKKYPKYKNPAAYTFNFEPFKQNVLEPLKKLPPPKHDPNSKNKKQKHKQSK